MDSLEIETVIKKIKGESEESKRKRKLKLWYEILKGGKHRRFNN